MKVEKIDRVVIRVKDMDKAKRFFTDLLGGEFGEPFINKPADLISHRHPVGIDLVAPLSPDGPTATALEKRGEGIAILALEVSNLEEAIAEMKSRGIKLVAGGPERAEHHPERRAAIFHPKDTYGVMIELVQHNIKR